ncbi:MAG: ABC transporter substrate-binding protein [Candidatus Dormibacteria bacterium]
MRTAIWGRAPAHPAEALPRSHRKLVTLLAGTATILVAACGGTTSAGSSSASSTSVGGKLVIDSYMGTTWPCTFNPFNPALNFLTVGFTYETLEYINDLQSGTSQAQPWLATGSAWSNNFETLTFTIRSGVKWNDGQPFSAADVAYTFNAMATSPALDLNALWKADGGPLTAVAVQGSNQVVFTFDTAAQTYFYYVADQVPIVPEHIWSSLDQTKLASYADSNPVGTGPYKVGTCTEANVKYVRNTDYWQSTPGHPVPRIAEVDYPSFLGNDQANLYLTEGQAQWGAQPVPNIKTAYLDKGPDRYMWFPPVLNVGIFPNLDNSLLSNVAVRQAISLALDRSDIAARGESGYEPAASQTGIITPTYSAWYDKSIDNTAYDPTKADQVLQAAGFTKGSDGIYQNAQGQPLSFTLQTVSGFSDWDASLVIVTQELKAVGIQITVEDENSGPYTTNLESGNFQLAYAGSGGPYTAGGPTPYYELRGDLDSSNIGGTNYSRYDSASTDALFAAYAATTNVSQQEQIIDQIEQVMVTDYPFIPVTQGVDWYTYDASQIGGWPTAANPYAQPSIYAPLEDNGVILDHLYPIN